MEMIKNKSLNRISILLILVISSFGSTKGQTVTIDTIKDYSSYRQYVIDADNLLKQIRNNDFDDIVKAYVKSGVGLSSKKELRCNFIWLRDEINKKTNEIKMSSVVKIVTNISSIRFNETSIAISYTFPSEYDGIYNEVIITFVDIGKKDQIEYTFMKAMDKKKIIEEIDKIVVPK